MSCKLSTFVTLNLVFFKTRSTFCFLILQVDFHDIERKKAFDWAVVSQSCGPPVASARNHCHLLDTYNACGIRRCQRIYGRMKPFHRAYKAHVNTQSSYRIPIATLRVLRVRRDNRNRTFKNRWNKRVKWNKLKMANKKYQRLITRVFIRWLPSLYRRRRRRRRWHVVLCSARVCCYMGLRCFQPPLVRLTDKVNLYLLAETAKVTQKGKRRIAQVWWLYKSGTVKYLLVNAMIGCFLRVPVPLTPSAGGKSMIYLVLLVQMAFCFTLALLPREQRRFRIKQICSIWIGD